MEGSRDERLPYQSEKDWHVAVRVDRIPDNWPYHEMNGQPYPVFAPQVSDIEPE
jgi:hypothetical protein